MKLFGIILICTLIVLVIVWIRLQEEPVPVIITLAFTGVLVALTVRFGFKAPLMIFGALIGAFIIFILLPAILSLIAPIGRMELDSLVQKDHSSILALYESGMLGYKNGILYVRKVEYSRQENLYGSSVDCYSKTTKQYSVDTEWNDREILKNAIVPNETSRRIVEGLGYKTEKVTTRYAECVHDFTGESVDTRETYGTAMRVVV